MGNIEIDGVSVDGDKLIVDIKFRPVQPVNYINVSVNVVRKTLVQFWEFHDGVTPINPGNRFGEMVPPRGWTCWVYPEDDHAFEEWMAQNCPTAECTHRFNSGDPMYTVYISSDEECMLFKLRWGV